MSPRPSRSGFTLIELLVVIAIIGVLIGLLLPAVQKVREAANRIRCSNNCKQLALAMHNYDSTQGSLPAALLVAGSPTNGASDIASAYRSPGFGPNWLVLCLPFIEQDALFKQYQTGINNFLPSNGTDQSWRGLIGTSISLLRCPTDANTATPFALNGGPWARGNYAASAGPGWYNWTMNGASDGSGGPFSGLDYSSGGVVGINWGCAVSQIPDGTSNTILLAEVRAGVDQNDRRGTWAMGTAGASVIAAAAVGDSTGPNDTNPKSDDIEDCQAIGNYQNLYLQRMGCSWDNGPHNWQNWQGNARSMHSNGVNVAFADGSVRFIENTIATTTWFKPLSRDDGQVIPSY